MVELSNERVEEILHKETQKTEELATILRGIYTRYMHFYETYFADIDALDDDKVAELKKYHEETKSLMKYYYMDIPLDVCEALDEFDKNYTTKLLRADWHKLLFESYDEFLEENGDDKINDSCMKAEFREEVLTAFYDAMDHVFREDFGTGSKTTEKVLDGIKTHFFSE